jgi:hypothetical protein
VNPLDLLNTIKGLFINPEKQWNYLKQRSFSWQQVYFYYAIPMVFLSAYAILFTSSKQVQVLGLSPVWLFFINISGSLISIALSAYLISKMAPRFLSLSSFDSTVMLISFAYTPVFIANILSAIHSSLALLNFVGIFYMVYLFFKGTTIVLDTPAYKLSGFSIINLILLFAVRLVITSLIAAMVIASTVGVEKAG